ncbi:MAG: hypothetical protein ACJAVN_000357 [Roseivirga sp.]|jgi:hypothetical protein
MYCLSKVSRQVRVRAWNTTAIHYVMKNGRLYEANTLNEVWPRKRQLPEQWWWSVEPPKEMRKR